MTSRDARPPLTRLRLVASGALTITAMTLSSCSDPASEQPALQVFAAASLTEVAEDLGQAFTEAEGIPVEITSAGSADLLAQIEHGAPADVFLPADQDTMERAQQRGLIQGRPEVMATNSLVLVVPEGNPADVTSIEDLAAPETLLVTCAVQVPCGALTHDLAAAHQLQLSPVSEENSVTDVLGKVAGGEADAGFVFRTDPPRAAHPVEVIEVPDAESFVSEYPTGLVAQSSHEQADDFVEFLQSPTAQDLLRDYGFGTP